jgi:hypothetical protein
VWARNIELALACWLGLSPFIFRHGPDDTLLWVIDLSCAAAVGTFSLLSYVRRLEQIHLLNIAVAGVLVAAGFLVAPPPPPAAQNWVVVGLLLLLFAIVPNHAALPPRAWREYYDGAPGRPRRHPGLGSERGTNSRPSVAHRRF